MVAASDVPLWAALLIGLGGGIAGALITISSDRGADMRSRMLSAAEKFLVNATEFDQAMKNLLKGLSAQKRPAEAKLERLGERLRGVDGKFPGLVAEVQLLFAPESKTMARAQDARSYFEEATKATEGWRVSGFDESSEAERKRLEAKRDKVVEDFCEAARLDLWYGASARWARRSKRRAIRWFRRAKRWFGTKPPAHRDTPGPSP